MSKPASKRKKNIPAGVRIITSDEKKSKDIVARAMCEMYRKMFNPL